MALSQTNVEAADIICTLSSFNAALSVLEVASVGAVVHHADEGINLEGLELKASAVLAEDLYLLNDVSCFHFIIIDKLFIITLK